MASTDLAAAVATEEVPSAPEPLRARLWRALTVNDNALKSKEMREACAFYDAVRRDARRCAPELVIDVCGGHGALGMLFVAHGAAKGALIIDQLRPPSHGHVLQAWGEFLGSDAAVTYDERPLQVALPEALARAGGKCLVVACHACQFLARDIMDCCLAAGADFAVCPCCPKDEQGRIQAAAETLGVDLGAALALAEMGRLAALGCDARLRTFDVIVSPMNRILLGHCGGGGVASAVSATEPRGNAEAAIRLQTAYARAQRRRPQDVDAGSRPIGRRGIAALQECKDSRTLTVGEADYEAQLAQKALAVSAILRPLSEGGRLCGELLAWPGMEVRRSPIKHFRARTVVPVGEAKGEGDEWLFRFVPDGMGGMSLVSTLDVDTLLVPVAVSLPHVAHLLGQHRPLQHGLRCVKFHASLGGDPPQLLVCLIYGPDGEAPTLDELSLWVAKLDGRLQADGYLFQVAAMAQSRGVQRCHPEGKDYIDERLMVSGRAEPLRYRQPFGSFSNPNPHIAIATAEWLSDVIRANVGTGTDLLELYCGAGSHTVALAPMFRHVLAVEINRHLVEGCQQNVATNGLDNVTVVRAPSEEFCKKVLRRRSYEIRDKDGKPTLQLNFGCTIVDPPRAGLDKLTLEAVSGYEHVLYVSCNPEALRRDLETFLETHDLCRLVLLDHFPFSAHAEVAVHLRRREQAPVAFAPQAREAESSVEVGIPAGT